MNYCQIKKTDIANGPGVRVSLFVSGCRHHCKGCFNPETWDFAYGKPFDRQVIEHLLDLLAPDYIAGLTLLGGDPLERENTQALLPFVKEVRMRYPHKSIWCFTGDLYEKLLERADARELFRYIDVLVDGPFIESQKNIMLRFRGSQNQRILDIKKSQVALKAVEWKEEQ